MLQVNTAGRGLTQAIGLASALTLSGCATSVPNIRAHGEPQRAEIAREGNLVAHIKCELTRAVFRIEDNDDRVAAFRQSEKAAGREPPPAPYSASWLNSWGSKVSLKVQVDESAAFAPSLTITNNLSNHVSSFASGGAVTFGQSFSLPLAVSGSSKATRTETNSFYFRFADLKSDAELEWKAEAAAANTAYDASVRAAKRTAFLNRPCPASGGVMMEGDLKIEDFIATKVLTGSVPGVISRTDGTPPFDAFGYEVTFVVTQGGSISPSWRLYPISINQNAPLFVGSRVRTNDMILTLGKVDMATNNPVKAADDVHQAALIGQAVAEALSKTP